MKNEKMSKINARILKTIETYNEHKQNNHDIIITIPKTINWEEYEKELKKVEDYTHVMSFKVSNFPKTRIGNKCYLVYDGNIIGWMKIVGLEEYEFTCNTTGKNYDGKFIQRSGPFNKIEPIPMKGFQGFRYL
jgi:hypothetical protein